MSCAHVEPKRLLCLMGCLVKGLVASPCTHTLVVCFVCGWVQSSFELLRDQRGKGETSAECKSFMKAVLTVTSDLDPFLLEDGDSR